MQWIIAGIAMVVVMALVLWWIGNRNEEEELTEEIISEDEVGYEPTGPLYEVLMTEEDAEYGYRNGYWNRSTSDDELAAWIVDPPVLHQDYKDPNGKIADTWVVTVSADPPDRSHKAGVDAIQLARLADADIPPDEMDAEHDGGYADQP